MKRSIHGELRIIIIGESYAYLIIKTNCSKKIGLSNRRNQHILVRFIVTGLCYT